MSTEISLSAFRAELRRQGLNAFIVPMDDAHMGEYSPGSERRIRALSGFLGSAGFIVVTLDQALIWTDGRYTTAIRAEVDRSHWTIRDTNAEAPMTCVADFLRDGDVLGFDPANQTIKSVEGWTEALAPLGARLQPVTNNPVDAVWTNRSKPPASAVVPHDVRFAGQSAQDKCRALGQGLAEAGLTAQVLNQSESLAWLLNARGDDIDGLPVARSFGTLHADGSVDWFIAPERVTDAMRAELGEMVRLFEPLQMTAHLQKLSGPVGLDHATCNAEIAQTLADAGIESRANRDPVILPRATKNATEQQGAREAHCRDAVAMIRFSRWLIQHPDIASETELSVAAKVLEFREGVEDPLPFKGPSFATISAFAGHAALAHYRVTEESNVALGKGRLLLVDSGGQYLNGTTDITRVWIPGQQATERQRRDYTLTLKGHLAIERLRFPPGTTGGQLDIASRQFLWAEGLDFNHGTGHGIGSYLGVHEGPQVLARSGFGQAFLPGMLVTNEPGFYREGESGIRIENVELVVELEDGFLGFETLTLVPYERALIETDLLTAEEMAQIDAYHARVLAEVGPRLDGADLDFLKTETSPLV